MANAFQNFADLFTSGAQGVADIQAQATQAKADVKEGIEQAKTVGIAYGGGTLIFQAITAFSVLYLAMRASKGQNVVVRLKRRKVGKHAR